MQVQYLNRLHLVHTVNLNTVPVVSTEMLLLNDIFKKKKKKKFIRDFVVIYVYHGLCNAYGIHPNFFSKIKDRSDMFNFYFAIVTSVAHLAKRQLLITKSRWSFNTYYFFNILRIHFTHKYLRGFPPTDFSESETSFLMRMK